MIHERDLRVATASSLAYKVLRWCEFGQSRRFAVPISTKAYCKGPPCHFQGNLFPDDQDSPRETDCLNMLTDACSRFGLPVPAILQIESRRA